MSSILFYNKICPMSKKIINTINLHKLQDLFILKDVGTLTNLDLINSGVEVIPTIINNNVYYEDAEGLDFIVSLIQYMKYSSQANKVITSENLIEDVDEKCAICMGEFEIGEIVQTFYCTHRFHKDCVISWRQKKNCCPTCNKSLN